MNDAISGSDAPPPPPPKDTSMREVNTEKMAQPITASKDEIAQNVQKAGDEQSRQSAQQTEAAKAQDFNRRGEASLNAADEKALHPEIPKSHEDTNEKTERQQHGKGADSGGSTGGAEKPNSAREVSEQSHKGQVGHASGEATLSRQNLEKTLNATPGMRDALRDPDAHFYVLGQASRKGNDAANQALSVKRAEEVVRVLKEEYGAKASFSVEGSGSEHARANNEPLNDDRASERVTNISYERPGTAPKEKPEIPNLDGLKGIPDKDESMSDKAQDLAKEVLFDIGKDKGIEAVAAKIFGHAVAETAGVVLWAKLGAELQVKALTSAVEGAHDAYKANVFNEAFADTFSKLVGGADRAQFEGGNRLSPAQIADRNPSALREPGEFMKLQSDIKSTARNAAIEAFDTFGGANQFAEAVPSLADRKAAVLEALKRPR